MSVVLLVMTSVAAAVGNVDAKGAGKIGFHTFKWIILFTFVSAVIGVGIGTVIKPGADIVVEATAATEIAEAPSFIESIVGFLPNNVFESMSSGSMESQFWSNNMESGW